jgi:DNA-binding GntR family transcriptional regulator
MRQASLADHQRIFAAIVDRDSQAAKLAMHQHIDRVVSQFAKGWA